MGPRITAMLDIRMLDIEMFSIARSRVDVRKMMVKMLLEMFMFRKRVSTYLPGTCKGDVDVLSLVFNSFC